MYSYTKNGVAMVIRTHWDLCGPPGDLWGPSGDLWGPSGDNLGNRFDEVIGFITDPDLPECADRSVSSSEYRWSEN